MAVVRRVMLAVVLILLVIDGALLAYVKFGSSHKKDQIVDIEFFVSDPLKVAKLKDALSGYNLNVSSVMREVQIQDGYVVVRHLGSKDLAEPVAKTLTKHGWKGLKVVDGSVQVGGKFKQRKKADLLASKLERKEKIKFEVEPGYKTVKRKAFKVVIKGVEGEQKRNDVVSLLDKQGIQDVDVIERKQDEKSTK